MFIETYGRSIQAAETRRRSRIAGIGVSRDVLIGVAAIWSGGPAPFVRGRKAGVERGPRVVVQGHCRGHDWDSLAVSLEEKAVEGSREGEPGSIK